MQGKPTEPGYNPYQVPPSTAEAAGGLTLPKPDVALPEPFKPEVSHQTVYEPLEEKEADQQPGTVEVGDQAEVIADLQRRLETAGRRITELQAENEELRAQLEKQTTPEAPKAPEHELIRDVVNATNELGSVWAEGLATVNRLVLSLEDGINELPSKVSAKVEPNQTLDMRVENSAKTMLTYIGARIRSIGTELSEGVSQVYGTRDRAAELVGLLEEYPEAEHRKNINKDFDHKAGEIARVGEYAYGEALTKIDAALKDFDAYKREAEAALAENNHTSTLAYRVFDSETTHLKDRLERLREQLIAHVGSTRKADERVSKKLETATHKLHKIYPGTEVQN